MLNLNPFKFKWQIRALYANGPRPSPAGCKIGDVYSVYPMFMGFVTLVLDRQELEGKSLHHFNFFEKLSGCEVVTG